MEREALEGLFEGICEGTRKTFLREGTFEPRLLILTRTGLAVVYLDFEEGFDREAVAREIGSRIRRTAIRINDEPIYDEPMAVILTSEAWMVEYDEEEDARTAELPPRLHPRRKEILQVTLRTRELSFSRNWPIERTKKKVKLGDPTDPQGMESVWDNILTSE